MSEPCTPDHRLPSSEELLALVRRQPRISLRELCAAAWPDLPWTATRPRGDSATSRIREWQVPLQRGGMGNRVQRATAAQWLRDQMQDLVIRGWVSFGRHRIDEVDREAGVSYFCPAWPRTPRRRPGGPMAFVAGRRRGAEVREQAPATGDVS